VIEATSPSGRFHIALSEREVFNTCWVCSPTLSDRETGAALFQFNDDNWSLDQARWLDDARVSMTVRKYPGNHRPANLTVTIDCVRFTAQIDGEPDGSLGLLESKLEASLHWIYATPPPAVADQSLLGRLRHFFRDRS